MSKVEGAIGSYTDSMMLADISAMIDLVGSSSFEDLVDLASLKNLASWVTKMADFLRRDFSNLDFSE